VCLAIPGQIVELAPGGHLAVVEVSKVRRTINIDLLEPPPSAGEWVLIHVGFAMSRVSGDEAAEQLRLLAMLGEDAQAMEELEGYAISDGPSAENAPGARRPPRPGQT
jgi:hydrogenase expression/formation protein HypC